jgi:hypothetical protein
MEFVVYRLSIIDMGRSKADCRRKYPRQTDPRSDRGSDRAFMDNQSKLKNRSNGYTLVEEMKTRLSIMNDCINDVQGTFIRFSDGYKGTRFDKQIFRDYDHKIDARRDIRREFADLRNTIMHRTGQSLLIYQQNLIHLWNKLQNLLYVNKGSDQPGLGGVVWKPNHSMEFTSRMWGVYRVILKDCRDCALRIGELYWFPSQAFEDSVIYFAGHLHKEYYAYEKSCKWLRNSIKEVI